jgi:Uncharacterised BCR, YnfA/UPF0060 family
MPLVRSLLLFALAALAEIGGALLVWQGVREHRGLLWIATPNSRVQPSRPASRTLLTGEFNARDMAGGLDSRGSSVQLAG